MFKSKRRGTLKGAIDRTAHPEILDLRAAVEERQEEVAELELELSDTRVELARFEAEFDTRVGHLRHRLDRLKKDLEEARHQAAYRAQWGDRADDDEIPDVLAQFNKAWKRREEPLKPPPAEPADEVTKEELKKLFRTLAKLYHPDLVTEPYQKKRREQVMAKINQSYAAQDVTALRGLLEAPGQAEPEPKKTRAELVTELRQEIRRLDDVIFNLTQELNRLTNSEMVKLMLDVSIAHRTGRDVLAEMAGDVLAEIAQVEAELASIVE
ncbi:MAG: hypothetical protein GTO14_19675 [Anaerolineales bacterium]|nr:hypothetical protein [Anaerolineales bacterium]